MTSAAMRGAERAGLAREPAGLGLRCSLKRKRVQSLWTGDLAAGVRSCQGPGAAAQLGEPAGLGLVGRLVFCQRCRPAGAAAPVLRGEAVWREGFLFLKGASLGEGGVVTCAVAKSAFHADDIYAPAVKAERPAKRRIFCLYFVSTAGSMV